MVVGESSTLSFSFPFVAVVFPEGVLVRLFIVRTASADVLLVPALKKLWGAQYCAYPISTNKLIDRL